MTDLVRPATPDDYPVYAALFRELGVDDPLPGPERFANELAPRILIYERGGEAIGYVSYYRLASDGYIQNLVVAPGSRGARIGEALMLAAAAELRALGVAAHWHLNVRLDNAPAIRLYERLGLRSRYPSVALRLAWADLDRLATYDAPLTVLPIPSADDAEVEQALGLLAGRLELSRARGRRLIQLRDAGHAPVGVACFDPAFPGAYPFAAARPGLAAPLLRALAPHAVPGSPEVKLLIEDDDALCEALIAAGADVMLRVAHYQGPLPTVAR